METVNTIQPMYKSPRILFVLVVKNKVAMIYVFKRTVCLALKCYCFALHANVCVGVRDQK